MRIVHAAGRDERVLADRVETAESTLDQLRGVMFRGSLPDGYGLVFPFDRTARRSVHMLFVRVPLDVLWLEGTRVERVERLRPWIGFGVARADTVVELPAGAATDVQPDETVRIEGSR